MLVASMFFFCFTFAGVTIEIEVENFCFVESVEEVGLVRACSHVLHFSEKLSDCRVMFCTDSEKFRDDQKCSEILTRTDIFRLTKLALKMANNL